MSESDGNPCGAVAVMVAALDSLDVASLDRPGVQSALSSLSRVRGWHDGLHVRLTRRLGELAEDAPSIFPEADIAAAAKTSRRSADQATKRAATLDSVPELEAPLSAGECSSEHVDALGRALRRLEAAQRAELAADGERLAGIAARTTPEEFDKVLKREIARLDPSEPTDRLTRQRRAARFRSWTDRDTGMVCFRGELDPETGLKVISRIDTTVETLFHTGVPEDCPEGDAKQDFLRAQAFTRLILRRTKRAASESNAPGSTASSKSDHSDPQPTDTDTDGADSSTNPDTDGAEGFDADFGEGPELGDLDHRCEMILLIDIETILHGLHDKSIINNGHDIDLPIESYRRMACLAAIIPAVLDSNGVVVDLGREVRLANRAQRRALRAMYDKCPIPGCRVHARHCEPHHIRWWRNWGKSDLNNLIPLCSKHHHAVHEGGWDIVMHPDRSLTITYPDGTIQTTGPPKRKKAA
jgi:hypothetical protein